MYCMSLNFCIYFTFIPPLTHIYAIYYNMRSLIFRCSTFHLTYKNVCVCISQHLCLHFSTFVFAFLNICHIICLCIYPDSLDICGYIYGAGSTDVLLMDRILFVTHITYATTNANTCIQKCINKFTHMHQHMHKFLLCENRILFYVITLNKTLFSQNKTLCIC
jgi:hypothetical protein